MIGTSKKDSVVPRKRYNTYELQSGCGVEACLELIGGKWKGVILHHLLTEGVLRFSEIQRLKPTLSPRILTAQLRELEHDGLIVRKVYPVVPPKVEYSLSSTGESLIPLIEAMQRWGDEYLLRINAPTRPRKSAVQSKSQSTLQSSDIAADASTKLKRVIAR
jgi:DNA-binding HxlR family transcriptional regulator